MICNTTGAYIRAHAEMETEGAFTTVPDQEGGFHIVRSMANRAVANAEAISEELVAQAPQSFPRDTQRELVKRFIQLAYLRGFNAGFKP